MVQLGYMCVGGTSGLKVVYLSSNAKITCLRPSIVEIIKNNSCLKELTVAFDHKYTHDHYYYMYRY